MKYDKSMVYFGKEPKLIFTYHVFDNRGKAKNHRSHLVDEKVINDIIIIAHRNGLQSFRGKGNVVISFFDTKRYIHSILVELNEENVYKVISVYTNKMKFSYYNFIRERNRINLYNNQYILERISKDRYVTNRLVAVKHRVERDDKLGDIEFLKSMSNVRKLKG